MTCIENPMVLVLCMTYNHEKYIEDALKGFVMQKTDFPFVVSIIDDASTDNNTSVIMDYLKRVCDADEVNPKIEEYGKVIDATPSNNPNCLLHVVFLSENHFGKRSKRPYYIQFEEKAKYIAMCEGDDYWTDPLKLQKQVDYLETHPEYDMVCTRFQHLYQENGIIEDVDLYNDIISEQSDGLELKHEHFLYSAVPHPCTVMYRRGTMEDNPIMPKVKYRFDIPTYWCYMYYHRVWLMNVKTAVYRKHVGSLTDAGVSFRRKIYEAYADIYQYVPDDDLLRQLCAKYFRSCIAMPNAEDRKYNISNFLKDFITYLSYGPTLRKKLSFIYKVARLRIKMLDS